MLTQMSSHCVDSLSSFINNSVFAQVFRGVSLIKSEALVIACETARPEYSFYQE